MCAVLERRLERMLERRRYKQLEEWIVRVG